MRVLGASSAIAVLVLASYWSIRFAHADLLCRANTLDSVARAAELDPGNARYHSWLAELEEHEGQDPARALLAAAALNPRDSPVWIRLGLRAEIDGDFTRAEKYLLESARVDRLSMPRATLMHYYFRRGDRERFWDWSKQALEMSYGDRTPLFRLCWSASDDAGLIRRRAIPPDRGILLQYLRFLMREGRLDAAQPIAGELAQAAGPKEAEVLLEYCDQAAGQGRVAPALALWNVLCVRKLAPYPPLALEKGILLTNGDFTSIPLGRGFDWHVAPFDEVTVLRPGPPAGLRLSFSGQQPERCDLLWQHIPLQPRRMYRLRFRYQTAGIAPPSGIRWRVLDAATPQLASSEWREEELGFASGDRSLARLSLAYERPPGTTRVEGTIELRNVTLGFAP
jgi:tetratricopeptide (TPR) repeat protein